MNYTVLANRELPLEYPKYITCCYDNRPKDLSIK